MLPLYSHQERLIGIKAKVAQLVERHLAKVEVASSSLVFRSIHLKHYRFIGGCSSGGIGRHVGLKIQWRQRRAGSSPASSTKNPLNVKF
jgi:hypothetical protein